MELARNLRTRGYEVVFGKLDEQPGVLAGVERGGTGLEQRQRGGVRHGRGARSRAGGPADRARQSGAEYPAPARIRDLSGRRSARLNRPSRTAVLRQGCPSTSVGWAPVAPDGDQGGEFVAVRQAFVGERLEEVR